MKATINPKQSDKIASHRKEKGFYHQITILARDTGQSVVVARFYWPRKDGPSLCYCCVWVHAEVHARGAGKTGGYGYHKESAALSDALSDAGVTLDTPIDSRGNVAMRDALEAVARAVTGKRKFYVVEAHA